MNPSLEVARALDGEQAGGAVVVALGLPVAYAAGAAGLVRAVESLSPVLVVGLGQSAGAAGLLLERAAINLSESGNLEEAAAKLFAALRELDQAGVKTIAVMPIPATGLGEAINDRLRRAADRG